MIFEPVTPQNAEKLRPYYINCNYRLCEYSVGVKLMWGSVLHPAFCEAANCLIVRNQIDGRYQFDFPVPGPEGDVDAALTLIEKYCTEQGVRPVVSVVPEGEAGRLFLRYPVVRLINERPWKDYIYRREDLAEFAGRHYSGQRNHIHKFRKLYPDAEGIYSWWSYRFKAREKNAGWRIDYFLVSEDAGEKITGAKIYTDVFGSDHCPVGLEIDL